MPEGSAPNAATQRPRPASTREPSPLDDLTPAQLKQLILQYRSRQKLGLYWERDGVAHERALNDAHVLGSLVRDEAGRRLCVGDAPWEHTIIEGDNFDALRLLRRTHLGKVQVVCIDPPYNTGKQDWVYNDRMVRPDDQYRQSQWLEHLYQRFVLARDLLAKTSVVLVFINDENRSKLELLLDDVFPGMRVGSFVWRTRPGSNDVTGPRFSMDHEHVLVYARGDFAFAGTPKTLADYTYDDDDGRGKWASKDLAAGVAYNDPRAGRAYYPLVDPDTGIYYPCNPNRVWAYVTRERSAPGTKFKSKTMDELIAERRIKWPGPDDRVRTFLTLDALLAAIDSGDVPKARTSPLLRRDLPDLEAWVGCPIGYGRPRLKRYLNEIDEDRQPLSSWIRPAADRDTAPRDDLVEIVSGYGEDGGKVLQAMFGQKVFNYPKPLGLVTDLLRQVMGPTDTVVDFYAGSGTTGHAVLALNAEAASRGDLAARRFILVSSTEATSAEPDKNLCRDVCAQRVRLAAEGVADQPALGGSISYLRVTKIADADLAFELTHDVIWNTLCLLHTGMVRPLNGGPIHVIVADAEGAVVFCPTVTSDVLAALTAMPQQQLRIYSDRPAVVAASFVAMDRTVTSLSARDAVLTSGTTVTAARARTAAPVPTEAGE